MKTTESMMPSAIDRNAGDGTSITALSEMSTVRPREQDGLAGGVHRLGDGVLDRLLEPKKAPRKR